MRKNHIENTCDTKPRQVQPANGDTTTIKSSHKSEPMPHGDEKHVGTGYRNATKDKILPQTKQENDGSKRTEKLFVKISYEFQQSKGKKPSKKKSGEAQIPIQAQSGEEHLPKTPKRGEQPTKMAG